MNPEQADNVWRMVIEGKPDPTEVDFKDMAIWVLNRPIL